MGTQACQNSRSQQGSAAVSAAAPRPLDSGAGVPPDAALSKAGGTTGQPSSEEADEAQFRSFFTDFQKAVKQNDPAQLEKMLYFPLQTARQWTNQDLKDMKIDKESGKVSRGEFNSYHEQIFTRDVQRMLPGAKEEQLSEIDARSPEDYYRELRKCTDKTSKMYEVYMQYPEENGTAENYFAFVFGRVNGRYKVIGYHAKWPVKG